MNIRAACLAVALAFISACKEEPPVAGVRASVASRSGSDTATVKVKWTALDTGLVFPWRSEPIAEGEAFAFADTAEDDEAVFQVHTPPEDVDATFCVRGLRASDGKATAEICADYVIPAEPPPLPEPDEVHIALIHRSTQYRNPRCLESREVCRRRDEKGECTSFRTACQRSEPQDTLACLTLRWDSVPGATRFLAELVQSGQTVASADVNDDSCPGCGALGLEGGRWPCFEFQQGCHFNVWPYYSAAFCVPHEPGGRPLQARVLAIRAGSRVAAETIEWTAEVRVDR